MKRCTKCSLDKPIESFSKKASNPDGLQRHCKDCNKDYLRGYYNANKEKAKAAGQKYREENREVRLDSQAEYREKNREKLRAYGAEHYAANRERRISGSKKWARENTEKRAAITKRYREKNPGVSAKYRASKLQRTPAWLTDYDWEMIDWTYHCAKVATEKFGETYHVDHIIPLQGKDVSGLHVPGNLQVIPASENMSKGNSYYG